MLSFTFYTNYVCISDWSSSPKLRSAPLTSRTSMKGGLSSGANRIEVVLISTLSVHGWLKLLPGFNWCHEETGSKDRIATLSSVLDISTTDVEKSSFGTSTASQKCPREFACWFKHTWATSGNVHSTSTFLCLLSGIRFLLNWGKANRNSGAYINWFQLGMLKGGKRTAVGRSSPNACKSEHIICWRSASKKPAISGALDERCDKRR